MLKQFKAVLCTMVVLLFSATNVWAVSKPTARENRCVVVIKDSQGDVVKYTKVSTEVSGGLSCVGGARF